ncbi:MAG: MraY family glycosyltransferase [Candidatus Hodarchaeota archaeon]
MKTYFVIFLCSFLICYLVVPLIRRYAILNGVMDDDGDVRRVHNGSIPRLGGVGIYLAFYLPFLGFLFYQNRISNFLFSDIRQFLGLLICSTIVLGLGIYDDIKGANATKKLTVQTIAAIILFFFGFEIQRISNPFGSAIYLGWLSLPVTVFWLVGLSNAFNLIDGIDGLASGVGFFAASALLAVALFLGNILPSLFTAALAGATLGFLRYNFNPAKIFMGDSGSLFLGFSIAAISIHGSEKAHAAVAILIPVMALGLPIIDTLLAIARRVYRGLPIPVADKEHIHHKLIKYGFSHRRTAFVLYSFCGVLSSLAVLLTVSSSILVGIILAFVGLVIFWGIRRYKAYEKVEG